MISVTGILKVIKRLLSLLAVFLLAACGAHLPPRETLTSVYLDESGALRDCAGFYDGLERLNRRYRVRDVQAVTVPGFPYLRSNRFLASFREQLNEKTGYGPWLERLRRLDQEARLLEIANLPTSVTVPEQSGTVEREELAGRIHECGELLMRADLGNPGRIKQLIKRTRVADNYRGVARVLGFYPISSWFVGRGVKRLHGEVNNAFRTPDHDRKTSGELLRYLPGGDGNPIQARDISSQIQASAAGPLGIPSLTRQQRDRLFARFAPIWEIDTVDDNDRPGAPYWAQSGRIAIDIQAPVVYRLLSHTRLNGDVLIQLNYILWFPSRPLTGPFDILGGHLDGITWRVTLGGDGQPVMYDAMHNCGCYHMFFPVRGVVKRPGSDDHEEPILIPATVPEVRSGQRMVIRIASGRHYIEDIRTMDAATGGVPYRLADYNDLRSLPYPDGGNRSMFGQDGIVAGTSRGERWLLWPMGIADPGAMRQWGRHATAFIGRRHFDDPFLLQKYFQFQ